MRSETKLALILLFATVLAITLAKSQGKKKKPKPRDSNRSLLNQLKQAEGSNSGSETESKVVLEKTPKFKSVTEEVKWKLNKARMKLRVAKQYVQLAEKVAKAKKKGMAGESAVKTIIRTAEVEIVHAGERMGLDYVHFKRNAE